MQKLFAVGVAIILAGFALIALGSAGQGSTSAGGVVFIGPIPIVFGSGPGGSTLALASLVIGAVMILLFLAWSRGTGRVQGESA